MYMYVCMCVCVCVCVCVRHTKQHRAAADSPSATSGHMYVFVCKTKTSTLKSRCTVPVSYPGIPAVDSGITPVVILYTFSSLCCLSVLQLFRGLQLYEMVFCRQRCRAGVLAADLYDFGANGVIVTLHAFRCRAFVFVFCACVYVCMYVLDREPGLCICVLRMCVCVYVCMYVLDREQGLCICVLRMCVYVCMYMHVRK